MWAGWCCCFKSSGCGADQNDESAGHSWKCGPLQGHPGWSDKGKHLETVPFGPLIPETIWEGSQSHNTSAVSQKGILCVDRDRIIFGSPNCLLKVNTCLSGVAVDKD